MRFSRLLILICGCCLFCFMGWGRQAEAAEKWAESLNEFSLRVAGQLEQDLDEKQGQSICSPLGVLTTLDMMREGAAGETLQELNDFLPLDSSQMERLRVSLQRWQQTEEQQVLFGASLTENDGYGMQTLRVVDGTPAEGSGLAKGDLVFEIDGRTILKSDDYNAAIDAAGPEIELVYFDRSAGKLTRKKVELAVIKNENASQNFVVANSLWHRKAFRLNPEFATAIASRPATELRVLPVNPDKAARSMNEWCSQLLQESVTPFNADQLEEDVRLVAANLVSVSGRWKQQFDPEKTRPQPFQTEENKSVQVDMMAAERGCEYAEHQGWKAVSLPLQEGKFNVLFVLPPVDEFMPNAEQVAVIYPQLTARLKMSPVNLRLPRATFNSRHASINESLSKIGLTTPFDEARADFSRLSMTGQPETFISEFFQQASFEMDEYGARATAVTAAISSPRFAVEGPTQTFHANRPFRFFVRESSTQVILFAGHVNSPTPSQQQ